MSHILANILAVVALGYLTIAEIVCLIGLWRTGHREKKSCQCPGCALGWWRGTLYAFFGPMLWPIRKWLWNTLEAEYIAANGERSQ